MVKLTKPITRIEYLKSLPKDEDGNPIIKNMDEFYELESSNGWEDEFVTEWCIGNGYITAYDYPEFFQIQE